MTEKNLGQGSVSISVPVVDSRSRDHIAAINLSTPPHRHDANAGTSPAASGDAGCARPSQVQQLTGNFVGDLAWVSEIPAKFKP